MYADKIETNAMALGVLAGQIPESAWGVVKLVRDNLLEQAQSVRSMEERLLVPDDEEGALTCPDGTGKDGILGMYPGEAVPWEVCEAAACPHRDVCGCWRSDA